MRRFVPRYKVVFSDDVSIGRRSVIFPDGRLFNTRYTEETHSKNSTYREFCTGKTRAGGTTLNLSNLFLCRPQINRAVQEVNDLVRKNKDSIEGLAEEVGKFKV